MLGGNKCKSRSLFALSVWPNTYGIYSISEQDKIFRRKRLSAGANFVHVYMEIWDKGILKINKFSM